MADFAGMISPEPEEPGGLNVCGQKQNYGSGAPQAEKLRRLIVIKFRYFVA
jgi:hypothetical protein